MIRTDGTPTIAHLGSTVDRVALPDILVSREGGSIFLVAPCSRKGREWIEENVDDVASQFWGDALVVEHRYMEALFDGMIDDGLVVR